MKLAILFAVLQGALVTHDTNEPVRSARVLLTRVDGSIADSLTAVADNDGKFVIRNLAAGTYRLFAEADGYMRVASDPITLDTAVEKRDVILKMIRTAVVIGRVLDRANDPVPNVYVRALKPGSVALVAETKTNDLGEYRLYGLPPGSYLISAVPYNPPRLDGSTYVVPTPPCLDCRGEGQAMMPLARLLAAGEFIDPVAIERVTYLPVYFPGTTDLASARPIQLEPGDTFDAG